MGRNHENRIVSEVDPIYEHRNRQQKIFRVAPYVRVSTDSSDQENSLKNQKDHYETMIRANPNWEYVGLYVDEGISGTSIHSEPKAKSVKCVRGEFLSDTFKPKITLAYKTMTFNMSCVNLFPNCQHVRIFIDEENLRVFVSPTMEYDKNGLKFANFKNGRNVPRTCTIKYFCRMLFDFMNWNPNAKHRILAIYQEFGDRKYLVFNLDEAQQVFSETTESEDGKKSRKTTTQMPSDWKERFGYTIDELDVKERLDFSSKLITIDHKTGEKRIDNIEPKPPTPEELILQQYGTTRPRKEKTKKDE